MLCQYGRCTASSRKATAAMMRIDVALPILSSRAGPRTLVKKQADAPPRSYKPWLVAGTAGGRTISVPGAARRPIVSIFESFRRSWRSRGEQPRLPVSRLEGRS